MVFAAKNDTMSKVITGVMIAVAVAGLIVPFITDIEETFVSLPIGAILTAVLVVSWFYKPKYYELTEAGLLIKRPVGTVKIGRSRIEKGEEVERKRFRFVIRTFGIGGVFGYFGSFYTTYYGKMRWYVTDMKNPVMLYTNDNKKIVISPSNKEVFIAELNKLIN